MAPYRGVSLIQIHPSPGADAETDIDIIAIHGLDTKSPDTWIWKSKSPGEDVNWLASPHMLPERVGSARIFTCDWPADLFEQPDLIQKTAKVFARLLLAGIKRRSLPKPRHKKKKDRPIVFIASCLGGIILMRALLIADHPPNEYTAIRRSTSGIVFLATPFRGTSFQDVANWAEPGLRAWALIRGQKVSNLLDSVKGSAFHLEELVRSFTQLCQDKDYPCQVTTFYETGMTSLHRKFPLSWLIPSPLINQFCQPKPLVDSSSATLDIVPHPLPLDRSHVMMNKFKDPEDSGYKDVAGKIEEILHNIRTTSLLDDADNWIRNKYYTADKLKIERLSGDLLSMDQCYINLAVVEHRGPDAGRTKERGGVPSPFSLFNRQKVETPDKAMQVDLATIFNQRKGCDGKPIQPRRILIRGRAGVGKTTLCKKIIHEFTQGTWSEWSNLFDRVLWVPLRNLKLKERREIAGYNFEQLFAHEYFSLSSEKSKFARELLLAYESELETNSSKTLFLLDGLDEVSQDLSEGSMSNFLKELLKQPNIIITSRPSGNMPLGVDLELETIGFYPDQVNDYIQKIFTDPKTVDKVVSFLRSHLLIQSLVRIPIQLDAFCYSWKGIRNDMPETMTALYQAIELSLWKKDILRLEKRHYQNPITPGQIQDADWQETEEFVKDEVFFLESLAFTGIYNDIIEFERKHLNYISKLIPGFLLNKIAPFLSFLRNSNQSLDNRNGSYHFIHLTFQEYFAARYFVRQWVAGAPLSCTNLGGNGKIDETEPVKFFQRHKYTARYDILWRFVAGLLDAGKKESPFYSQKIEEFFQKIEEEPLDLLGPTHQRLIMHCLSEVSNGLPLQVELEQRLSKWLLFECEFTQSSHSYLASEVEFPEQALTIAFREGSDKTKEKSLRSLLNWATFPASVLEQVVSWLEHDESMPRHHFHPLHQISLPEKALYSVSARLKHKDKHIREAAAEVLSWQALPDEILKDMVAELMDKDSYIREETLGVLSRQKALPNEILKDIAARFKDKDKSIHQVALAVLCKQALPEEILKDITTGLKDKDNFIRHTTFRALGFQKALPIVILEDIAAQLNDKSVFVRDCCMEALDQQTPLPYGILKAVVARFNDDEKYIRKAAIKVLGRQIALPHEILNAIVTRLKDKEKDVREATILFLINQVTLPDEVLKAIAMQLNDADRYAQTAALRALRQQNALPYEIIKTIAARLNDDDTSIREAAVEVLGRQTALPHEILNAMVERLNDKKRDVREATIYSLARQATLPDEIITAIAVRLNDMDRYVQTAAIKALRWQKALSYEIIKAVAARLNDDDTSIREAAIKALRQQKALPYEIIKAIAARLNDDDIFVRKATIEALGRQTALPEDILELLAARLTDKDAFIQHSAEFALRRHGKFYSTLLRGPYTALLYDILLRQSFEEHLSWYIDDGYSCINLPEGVMKAPIDDHDDIRAIIKKAQPANFPTR